MFEKASFCRSALVLVLAVLALPACGDDGGDAAAPDASTDTDTDSDSDLECVDSGVDDTYQWHTFHGNDAVDESYFSGWDDTYSLIVDASGDLYISGGSNGAWNGPSGELPLHSFSGSGDLFVLKLDEDGNYLWHTFYGSPEGDGSGSIVLDDAGNIFVAVSSDSSWNGPGGETPLHDDTGVGYGNLAVLSLDVNGSYRWHTFIGHDGGGALSIDESGNLFVSGSSLESWYGPDGESPLHPLTPGFDEEYGVLLPDLYVLKLDSSGEYQWHTFYGGTGHEIGPHNTVDASGDVYVAGTNGSYWTGPSGESPLNGSMGGGFVLKLTSDGEYEWHLFVPPYQLGSMTMDESGFLYFSGSSSAWVGPDGESPLHAGSGADIFVAKFDTDGEYQWHTFYGSVTGPYPVDSGAGLAVADDGGVFVTGASFSSWNGPDEECPLQAFSGPNSGNSGDIFILNLDADGKYGWHTFYGFEGEASPGYAAGREIAKDDAGMLYVTGVTDASWDGPAGESPLHAYAGGRDVFVLKLAP